MLCIEFPSASPADVRGPQAVDLCGAARALLGDCSPLKTPTLAQTHTQTDTHTSWDLVANYMPITASAPPLRIFLFSSQGHLIYKVIYMFIKFGVKARFVRTLWENRCSINFQPAGIRVVLKLMA